MKQLFLLLITFFTFTITCNAQDRNEPEKTKPLLDTEVVRKCAILDIEGTFYYDVSVEIKSKQSFWGDDFIVKVRVEDENGKKIYKNTFDGFLYIFSNGQIQVGKPNFSQMLIQREGEIWVGKIREKEGIY